MTKEEAIKWLNNLLADIGQMRHQDLWDYAQAITEISEMIAETPDIVRCEDCKCCERKRDVCHNPRFGDGHANYPPPYVGDDFFYADGERKEYYGN